MQYRTLGETDISVSEIGYGAWGIGSAGWGGADDAESLKALHAAVDHGVNFIDTALAYGEGHSECVIGRLLKERSDRLYVATKVPPKNRLWPAREGIPVHEVYPPDHIVASAEQSLRNLGTDRIDLLQLHIWLDAYLDEPTWFEAVDKLKSEGKIAHFGISVNDHAPDTAQLAVLNGIADTVQVIYNIFDQSPADNLFDLCIKENVGVIARVPFDEGGLTGTVTPETEFPKGDWRRRYFAGERKSDLWERVQKLQALLGDEAATLPELALRFCLSHPAVSTVIPGMRSIKNVRMNTAVSDGRILSQELLAELKKHEWRRNFY
jgi:aryl-alcohol dehydrogenase-like predicted oxidoreductase